MWEPTVATLTLLLSMIVQTADTKGIDLFGAVVVRHARCVENKKPYYCYHVVKEGKNYIIGVDGCGKAFVAQLRKLQLNDIILSEDVIKLWERGEGCVEWDI